MSHRTDRTSLGRPLLVGGALILVFAVALGSLVAVFGSSRVAEQERRDLDRAAAIEARAEAAHEANDAAAAAAALLAETRRAAEGVAREIARSHPHAEPALGADADVEAFGNSSKRLLAPAEDVAAVWSDETSDGGPLRVWAARLAPSLRTAAFRDSAAAYVAVVFDGSGLIVSPAGVAAGTPDSAGAAAIDRFLRTLAPQQPADWVDADRGAATYAVPALDSGGQRVGTVFATCDAVRLARALGGQNRRGAALVATDGAQLAATDGFADTAEEAAARVRSLRRGDGIFFPPVEGSYATTSEGRLAAVRVPGAPFTAAVSLPPVATLPRTGTGDAAKRFGLAVFGVSVVIGAVALICAFAAARAHGRRVAPLATVIEAHERGDYLAAADASGQDDIAEMARWLNTAGLRLRRAEARADEGGRRLRSLLDATGDAFVTTDAEDRIVQVNPRFAELLRRPAGSLAGHFVEELLVPESLVRYRAQLRRRLQGKPARAEVVWNAARAPHPRTIVSAVPLFDDDGRYSGSHVVVTDLTDRVRAHEETARAEKVRALGEMAGGVAHDFNNVLTVILGNAQYLLLDDLPPEQRQTAAAIERAALEGTETVRRLREFTRSRIVPHDAAAFSVNDVIERVLVRARERFAAELATRGAEYRVVVGRGSRRLVRGTAAELVEALANMVDNALDAMPKGGTLTIESFDRGEDAIAVRVEDTGCGMSRDILKKVFDPFFTTKSGGRCPGLGLSIAFGIARAHRGRIDVKSAPGEGSTFTIVLPATALADGEVPLEPGTSGSIPRVEPRVLLASGDADDIGRLRKELAGLGMNATCVAPSSAHALAADRGMFNTLVVDHGANPEVGWDLARQSRVARPDLRILLVTTHDDPVSETQATNAGIDRVLVRPFDARDLHAEIFALLATPRERAASPVPASARPRRPGAPRTRAEAEGHRTCETWAAGEIRTGEPAPPADAAHDDDSDEEPEAEPSTDALVQPLVLQGADADGTTGPLTGSAGDFALVPLGDSLQEPSTAPCADGAPEDSKEPS